MSFDRSLFADKVRRHRDQFGVSTEDMAKDTGIPVARLEALEDQKADPTGDEILILADFFRCDFQYFISNEMQAVFEKTEALFRAHSADLGASDRWAVQEFLYLCECEQYLLEQFSLAGTLELGKPFVYIKRGGYFKGHGSDAASKLRSHLGYSEAAVPLDVFADFRRIGVHVFRRSLGSRNISGLFVRHPSAGLCVLVNYDEHPFRQRFTVAHEVGHALLDDSPDFGVSYIEKRARDLSETRANTFASCYLIPPVFLKLLHAHGAWSQQRVARWAPELMVSVEAFVNALKDAGLVSSQEARLLRSTSVVRGRTVDPELPETLSSGTRSRKQELLKRGLSDLYVELCIRGYREGLLSRGRLAEVLLVSEWQLPTLLSLFGVEGGVWS